MIGPGDVQWMTAGAGILHEEFHSDAFTHAGGTLEMVQLWVNLPARDKMTPPGYQAIVSNQIPVVPLPDEAGTLRVIAGDYQGHAGAAHTFTPMQVWDVNLKQGSNSEFSLRDGWNSTLIVLRGTVLINGEHIAREAQMVMLDSSGSKVQIEATSDAVVLVLSGEAIADFNSGKFAQIPAQYVSVAERHFESSGHDARPHCYASDTCAGKISGWHVRTA